MQEPPNRDDEPRGAKRALLWVLGMLYVFVGSALLVTGLSALDVIEPPGGAREVIEAIESPGDNPNCDPSYLQACLDPDAEDYDCEGVPGNGPLFVADPVIVDGPDRHLLDSDGDGIGCE